MTEPGDRLTNQREAIIVDRLPEVSRADKQMNSDITMKWRDVENFTKALREVSGNVPQDKLTHEHYFLALGRVQFPHDLEIAEAIGPIMYNEAKAILGDDFEQWDDRLLIFTPGDVDNPNNLSGLDSRAGAIYQALRWNGKLKDYLQNPNGFVFEQKKEEDLSLGDSENERINEEQGDKSGPEFRIDSFYEKFKSAFYRKNEIEGIDWNVPGELVEKWIKITNKSGSETVSVRADVFQESEGDIAKLIALHIKQQLEEQGKVLSWENFLAIGVEIHKAIYSICFEDSFYEEKNLQEIFKELNTNQGNPESEKPTKFSFKSAEASDIGGRDNNEDNVLRIEGETSQGEPYGVYLVADGMGGEADGEAASKAVSDAVKAGIEVGIPQENLSEFVRNLLLEAQKKVVEGGTTATLALVIGDKAYLANVGDSRAYLVGVDGDFRRLTTDNSMVELFVELGHESRSETYASPVLNKLTHKLGQGEGAASFEDIKVSVVEGIKPGDKLLLCSDGVWGVIRDDSWEGSGDESGGRNSGELQQIVKDNSPQDAVEALIARVKAIGPEQRDDGTHRDLDNISAIVMEVARQETNGEQIDRLLAELDQESKDTEDGVAELEINYEESFESAHQRLQGRDDINWDDEESLQDKEIKIWSPIWAEKSLITNASVIKASAGDFEQFIFRHIVDKLVEKRKVINVDSFSGFDGIYELTVCSDIFEKDFEQLSEQYPDLAPDDILKNLFEKYKELLVETEKEAPLPPDSAGPAVTEEPQQSAKTETPETPDDDIFGRSW